MNQFFKFMLLWVSILGGLGFSIGLIQGIAWLFGPAGVGVFIVLFVTAGIAWAFSDL